MHETLASLVVDVMGFDVSEVKSTLSREEEERWDSLNHLRLITAIEQTFSTRLTMDEIENIVTLGDLDNLIADKAASA